MHVVVTGASSGIGEAIAREWAAAGASLTLVARREDRLRAIADSVEVPTHVVAWDLSDRARATGWLADAVAALGPVDVLVNNAGMQIISPSAGADADAGDRLLDLNLSTPLRITAAVLPSMIERGAGTIVDVASMAALAPTPGMLWYNASKGGLAAASEALRGELRNTGVHVVTVYPGIIPTALGEAGLQKYETTLMERLQPRGTSPALARHVRRAVERRLPRVIYPAFNRLARRFPGLTRWVMDHFTPPLRQG